MLRKALRHICVIASGSLLAFTASGCGTSSFDRKLVLGELDARHMVERLRIGETTRADEQAFILKSLEAWSEAREDRGLVNPTREGPLAADFQAVLAKTPNGAFRDLVWAWLGLAVTNPSLDLGKDASEMPTRANAP
jgi:hypothetical protein